MIERLVKDAQAGTVPHALLFCGPEGVGKLQTAIAFARYLLCRDKGTAADSCGKCPACILRRRGLADALLHALERAGAHFLNEAETASLGQKISKADLYRCGLSGGEGSREKRAKLLKDLDLPERLTADGLLDVLNATMSREDFLSLMEAGLPAKPAGAHPEED